MKRRKSLTAALIIALSAIPSLAEALSSQPRASSLPRIASAMIEGEVTMPPIAFIRFCTKNRAQCEATGEPDLVTLDDHLWRQLATVNSEVNGRIIPDGSKGSIDWSLEAVSGNCNDYAVQKQEALVHLGFPVSALSLTAARLPNGEGHLVLTVRTDRGDFVLDNMHQRILGWKLTGYHWIARQSAEDPKQWISLEMLRGPALPNPSENQLASRKMPMPLNRFAGKYSALTLFDAKRTDMFVTAALARLPESLAYGAIGEMNIDASVRTMAWPIAYSKLKGRGAEGVLSNFFTPFVVSPKILG